MTVSPQHLDLVFSGEMADQQQLPVLELNRALTALQRAIHLLAMQHENMEVREKDRVSRKIEEKYALLCSVPEAGSFAMPVTLGAGGDLVAPIDRESVFSSFQRISCGLCQGDSVPLQSEVPDVKRRNRLLDAFAAIVPRPGSGLSLRVSANGQEVLHSEPIGRGIAAIRQQAEPRHEWDVVTGRLVRMDFDEKKITIVYAPANRNLDCFYSDAAEDMLLERPRELVQVMGQMRVKSDNTPEKIVEVQDIEELDMSAFHVSRIPLDEFELVFDPPLHLEPELDESEQYLTLRQEALDLDVVAQTRAELEDALEAELAVLWEQFAREDEAKLSPKAQELKSQLLQMASEVKTEGNHGTC